MNTAAKPPVIAYNPWTPLLGPYRVSLHGHGSNDTEIARDEEVVALTYPDSEFVFILHDVDETALLGNSLRRFLGSASADHVDDAEQG